MSKVTFRKCYNILVPKDRIVFGQLSDKIQNITGRHIGKIDADWFRKFEERPKSAFAVIVAVVCFCSLLPLRR